MAIPSEQYVEITSNVVGGTTGGSGSDSPGPVVNWGDIFGEIENQTDLITYLFANFMGKENIVLLTGSRQVQVSDNNKTLYYAGAADISLSVPEGLPDGFTCTFVQVGLGKIATIKLGAVVFENLGSSTGQNTFFTLQWTAVNKYSHQNPGAALPTLACGIPFIMFSSWTMGANGALTLSVALPTAFPNAYVYFPAGAIGASVPAGWYYTTFSTTTAGTVYNNTYTSGTPTVPGALTPFVGAAGAVAVQVTTQVIAQNTIVRGGSLGKNGQIRVELLVQANNSAAQKTALINYGGGQIVSLISSAANIYPEAFHKMQNQGVTNRQMSRSASLNSLTGAPNYTNVDSSADQTLAVVLTLATAAVGDYVIASSLFARVSYGA